MWPFVRLNGTISMCNAPYVSPGGPYCHRKGTSPLPTLPTFLPNIDHSNVMCTHIIQNYTLSAHFDFQWHRCVGGGGNGVKQVVEVDWHNNKWEVETKTTKPVVNLQTFTFLWGHDLWMDMKEKNTIQREGPETKISGTKTRSIQRAAGSHLLHSC